jgi:hypothetical protein
LFGIKFAFCDTSQLIDFTEPAPLATRLDEPYFNISYLQVPPFERAGKSVPDMVKYPAP